MSLHCWKDEGEYAAEKYGFGSDEWVKVFLGPGGTCMLEAEHKGEHEFASDDNIGVTFHEELPPSGTREVAVFDGVKLE